MLVISMLTKFDTDAIAIFFLLLFCNLCAIALAEKNNDTEPLKKNTELNGASRSIIAVFIQTI